MSFDRDTLIRLLPAVYAQRDAETGNTLGDLLGLLAERIRDLEEDLEQLYDDQFIETCADWAVPYIGDAIAFRNPHGSELVGRARAEVAHTIGFRRRKGTLSVLEGVARDATDWPAVAAEFFQRLITTQYTNHVRRHIHAAPDLRRWLPLEQIDTAFDAIPRSVDVRRIDSRRGKHNIPNIGLFAWRLLVCPTTLAPPARVDTRRHRFHPLNIDQPLFTRPAEIVPESALARPVNVPGPISRRVLHEDLKLPPTATHEYYVADTRFETSLRLHVDRNDGMGLQVVPAVNVCACHLATTVAPDAAWAHPPAAGMFAVDPVLGRLYLPPEATDAWRVRLEFHTAFPAEVGGGEYERRASFHESNAVPRRVPEDFPTIQQALTALGGAGIVLINDDGRYQEALTIDVAAGRTIEIRAANHRRPTILLTAELRIRGGARSSVRLNGLLIAGDRLIVPDTGTNGLEQLELRHCTLVPGLALAPDLAPVAPNAASLVVELADFSVSMQRCVSGALRIADGAKVRAADSAIDSTRADNFAFAAPDGSPGADLTLEGCTVVGRITARHLPLVSNCLLWAESADGSAPVRAEFRQDGCVRFTWLPENSSTPRRHRCLPESAPGPKGTEPRFTAVRYGSPGYLQLNVASGELLMTGADDEAEPGVYHHRANTWREANLRARLDEYLRVGLQAGIFYET